MCGNEDALLGEAIYYYQDSSKSFGIWEVFNEIHGDGMPQTGRDGKLTEKAIGFMMLGLVLRISCTGSTIVSNECVDIWPSILSVG